MVWVPRAGRRRSPTHALKPRAAELSSALHVPVSRARSAAERSVAARAALSRPCRVNRRSDTPPNTGFPPPHPGLVQGSQAVPSGSYVCAAAAEVSPARGCTPPCNRRCLPAWPCPALRRAARRHEQPSCHSRGSASAPGPPAVQGRLRAGRIWALRKPGRAHLPLPLRCRVLMPTFFASHTTPHLHAAAARAHAPPVPFAKLTLCAPPACPALRLPRPRPPLARAEPSCDPPCGPCCRLVSLAPTLLPAGCPPVPTAGLHARCTVHARSAPPSEPTPPLALGDDTQPVQFLGSAV